MRGSKKPLVETSKNNFSIIYVFDPNSLYNMKRVQTRVYESMLRLCVHFFKLQIAYLLYGLGKALWLVSFEKNFD